MADVLVKILGHIACGILFRGSGQGSSNRRSQQGLPQRSGKQSYIVRGRKKIQSIIGDGMEAERAIPVVPFTDSFFGNDSVCKIAQNTGIAEFFIVYRDDTDTACLEIGIEIDTDGDTL